MCFSRSEKASQNLLDKEVSEVECVICKTGTSRLLYMTTVGGESFCKACLTCITCGYYTGTVSAKEEGVRWFRCVKCLAYWEK